MQTPRIDPQAIAAFLSAKWDQDIVPQLVDYIRIPNKSPMFDKAWQASGHMDAAVALMETWARAQAIPRPQVEVVRLEGPTPLISAQIPATREACRADNVMQYGPLDQ